MALVVDCSVIVPWYFESEASPFTNELLGRVGSTEMHVPALWVLEFASAIRNAERRRRISAEDRRQILGQAAKLALNIDATVFGIEKISAIAEQHALTPYDAVYFELAQRREFTLATLDEDLVHAARAAKLELLTDLSLYPEPVPPKPNKPKT
jgi:predicted nucleic acid-binding protein